MSGEASYTAYRVFFLFNIMHKGDYRLVKCYIHMQIMILYVYECFQTASFIIQHGLFSLCDLEKHNIDQDIFQQSLLKMNDAFSL